MTLRLDPSLSLKSATPTSWQIWSSTRTAITSSRRRLKFLWAPTTKFWFLPFATACLKLRTNVSAASGRRFYSTVRLNIHFRAFKFLHHLKTKDTPYQTKVSAISWKRAYQQKWAACQCLTIFKDRDKKYLLYSDQTLTLNVMIRTGILRRALRAARIQFLTT